MRIRKRSLTLVEVMIALFLLGVLSSALFAAYRQIAKANAEVQNAKQVVLPRERFQQKLAHLFRTVGDQDSLRFFTTPSEERGPSLFFTFDNGVDLDPKFCHAVEGMLYLSPENKLLLVTWPKEGEPRYDVFFDQVKTIKYSFYDKETQGWVHDWPESKNAIPPVFKIELDDNLEFAFFLQAKEKNT